MAQVIVDEALLREPNLWAPGKKPIGRVKIDNSHPLARGLLDVCLFSPNRGYANYYGLKRNLVEATFYIDHTNPITGKADYLNFQSAGTTVGEFLKTSTVFKCGTDSWTWLLEIRITSFINTGGIFGNGAESNSVVGATLRTVNSGSLLQMVVGNGTSRVAPSIALTAGVWYRIGIIINRSGNLSIIQGANQASSDISSHSGSYSTTYDFSIGRATAQAKGAFDMKCFYVVKRAMSISEVLEWQRDPHQILIPA